MAVRRPLDAGTELLEAFDHDARVTEYLVGVLPGALWRAEPPHGRGRSIAKIVAHMHGVRRTFARMAGARDLAPLDAARATQAQAVRALERSRAALNVLFGGAVARGDGRIKGMPRRTVAMMFYLAAHDAHHRGQICSLARASGHEFSGDDVMRMWGWKKLP